MKNFQQNLKKLEATDTQVLGVSMDSPFANHAFADSIGVTFPSVQRLGRRDHSQVRHLPRQIQAARRVNFLIGKDGRICRSRSTTRHRSGERSWTLRAPKIETVITVELNG